MLKNNLIDTPTRLVNHSNEFLPPKKKINPEKLAKKEVDKNRIKNYKDIEQFSDIEKSQQSTFRKQEDEKREMLFKIVTPNDIQQLQMDIQRQLKVRGKSRISVDNATLSNTENRNQPMH
jgi:hypothetical protein